MNEAILKQIISIRDAGIVNMCDCRAVQRTAFDHKMYDLVLYIEENPSRYFYFILHGKEPEND